jgi:hypothetical protein
VRWIASCLLLVLTACPSSMNGSQCAAVGESCEIFCCTSLSCHATDRGGYCTKGCRCHGGGSICAPATFEDGCPQGAVCLAAASDGTGECVRLCESSPCNSGEVFCGNPADGGLDAGITCALVPPPDMLRRD